MRKDTGHEFKTYKCEDCGSVTDKPKITQPWEFFHIISHKRETTKKRCPTCNSEHLIEIENIT